MAVIYYYLFTIFYVSFSILFALTCFLHPSRIKYLRLPQIALIIACAFFAGLASAVNATGLIGRWQRPDKTQFEFLSIFVTMLVQLNFLSVSASWVAALGAFQTGLMLNHMIPRAGTVEHILFTALKTFVTEVTTKTCPDFLTCIFSYLMFVFLTVATLAVGAMMYSFLIPRMLFAPRDVVTRTLALLNDISLIAYYALAHTVQPETLFVLLMTTNAITLSAFSVREVLVEFNRPMKKTEQPEPTSPKHKRTRSSTSSK